MLLDTHALLWWADGRRMTPAATEAIQAAESAVFVSAVTIWEAEIKIAVGKLRLGFDVESEPERHGFASLPITAAHAARAGRLPRHHGDPWDRMLIAQAQLEGLTLVTRDPVFSRYQVALLAA